MSGKRETWPNREWLLALHRRIVARPPHDAEMAAARDADRVARAAEGGGL